MIKPKTRITLAASLLLLSCIPVSAQKASGAESSASVISGTVRTNKTEKPEWKPFKVCVMDFDSVDSAGQKRFLDGKNVPIVIPSQSLVGNPEQKGVGGVMQGVAGMIEALDNAKTNADDREAQKDDNVFTRKKALDLYNAVMKGESRPVVIGAEYLSAYLGRHSEVFGCVDASLVAAAMQKLQKEPDFPQDFMLRIAKETGVTHLIFGTVSDLRTKINSFSGYGIETTSTTFELDVIIKVIDLVAQHSVYSNVYTGTYREQRPISAEQFDNNIFQSLMKSALEQAAEELYDICREGRRNKITVTPLPYTVTINVSGGMFFKPSEAEVYVDGVRVAAGGEAFLAPGGKHKLEIKASGYKPQTLELDVKSEQTIAVKLEK